MTWALGAFLVAARFEAGWTKYWKAARGLIRRSGVWPSAKVVSIDRIVMGAEPHVAVRELTRYSI